MERSFSCYTNMGAQGVFTALKDKAVSQMVETLLEPHIRRYGRISDVQIHSQKKQLSFVLHLLGEASPVEVNVSQYELLHENERDQVVVREVTTSREWITALAQDFLVGKAFPVPKIAASVL